MFKLLIKGSGFAYWGRFLVRGISMVQLTGGLDRIRSMLKGAVHFLKRIIFFFGHYVARVC